MRLLVWIWDKLKNIFAKKSPQEPVPTLVELQPKAEQDPMECLEGFIEVTLTV